MRALSATEAIGPAINRTKAILFQPFRKGRSWKLAATAYLCRVGTMFFPFPLIYLVFLPAARSAGTRAVSALCIGVALFLAIFLLFFYVCSRLQFAFFDIVVNRGEFVAPAWRKYGRQFRPWTTVKVVLGTAVALVCVIPIAAYIRHLLPLLQVLQTLKPGQPPPPQFMAALFAGYGIILLIFGPFFLMSSLLCDFIVPPLALEDTGLTEAFRRLSELIRREPGEFILYTLLKLGLGFAAYMGATIAWEIIFVLSTLIVAAVAAALGFLLHLAGVPAIALTALALLVGIAWYVFFLGYALLLTIGTVLTFLDAYAIYFLSGRYPILGELLDRSEPPAPVYMPPPGYAPHYPPPPPHLAG
jgi:hypothetical protein